MKKTTNPTIWLLASSLSLLLGCVPTAHEPAQPGPPVLAPVPAPEPKEHAPEPTAQKSNKYIGTWEGTDSNGDVYTFTFSATTWDSYIKRGGKTVPYYRGAYTFTRAQASLQVEEENGNGKWVPHKDGFPPLTGTLKGNVLTVPALTDVELMERQ